MSLLSLAQLEAMLEVAQEFVGSCKLVKLLSADMTLIVQFLQGKKCASRAQSGL